MDRIVPILIMFALINGCSDGGKQQNAFQTQIDAVDKANEVEAKILDAASRQQQAIEEETQ